MEKSVKFKSHHYRPLIPEVTIKESDINGLGLFALEDLKAGVFIGETHIWEEKRWDWIRTPLGGFINHSKNANCVLQITRDWDDYLIYNVFTTRKIKKNEEIDIVKHWIALGSFLGFMILIFFILIFLKIKVK